MFMASLALFIPPARAAINILEFSPSATLMNSSDTQVNYQLDDFVNPQEAHFSWNFSKGMDSVLAQNLAQIKLKEAASGAEVELDRGDPATFKLDENGVIAAGDFKYTKKGGGNQKADSNQLRLVELNLKGTSLKPGTNYVIELGAGISNNADNEQLGKTYSWAFTTTEAGDTSAPTWAKDSNLQVTDLAPTSVTLSWPAAVDNTAVTGYKVYQDGNVVATVNDTTRIVTDLTPNASYIFKVEAGDAAGNWTKDGPQATVITPLKELLAAPVLKADTTDNVVGNSVTLTFEDNEGWRKAINGITVDGTNLKNTEYTVSAGIIEIATAAFTDGKDYSIVVKAADYKDATVTQKMLVVDNDNTGGSDPKEEPGPVPGSGAGTGENKDQDFVVESFSTRDLSPSSTVLWFDFSSGADTFLADNLSKIRVYEKSTGDKVEYSNQNYTKQGSKDNPPKIRRIELTFNNLKSGTTYGVEIEDGFKANNSNELSGTRTWQFTTTGSTTGPDVKDENTVGSGGGTVDGAGATVKIPAGALSQDIKVSIKKVENTGNLPLGSEKKLVSDVVEITKDQSGDFDKAITITLTFDKSKVDADKYEFGLYWLDEKADSWKKLENVKVDLSAGKASGEITHLSKFAVLAVGKTADPIENPEPEQPGKPLPKLTDINGHWAQKTIEELVATGAISGYPDGTFKPNRTVTRAEFATILVKAWKLESDNGKVFSDTSQHWAKDSIAVAGAHGIVKGYSDTTFGPNDNITREQMAVMIARALKLGEVAVGKPFVDSMKISTWAWYAVAATSKDGIITGYPDTTFRPQANTTRAEAATVIVRALKSMK
jgi:hypothetical protein